MAALWLLSVSAAIEAAIGVALIIYPQAVAILVATALATVAGRLGFGVNGELCTFFDSSEDRAPLRRFRKSHPEGVSKGPEA
jgi:hypothetical protein